jgi:aryl-alcohol dehydrogenase-like predicted oxidoreductase
VLPELFDVDPANEAPELPDVAIGEIDSTDAAPAPPEELLVPTLEPPLAATSPPGARRATRLTAPPPAPVIVMAGPAGPPPPPTEAAVVPLAAMPVSPERAAAAEAAPVLADESAPPAATAPPVDPDPPVEPVVTAPPTTVAEPRMAVLLAVGDDEAPPVLPVGPESPAWATGADSANDEAAPVLPVFVLPDCDVAAPVLPEVAVGLMVTVEAPPEPPLAAPVAAPLPPTWAPAGAAAAAKARAAAANAAATPDARCLAADLKRLSTFTSFTATGEEPPPAILTRRPAVRHRTYCRRVDAGEDRMRYKLFGHTGLRVAELALGTMTFGPDWGWGADKDESRAMFDAYAEAGGNFIDTANRYTNGTAERLVGEFVGDDRDRFVIATKYTLSLDAQDPNGSGNHRKSLVTALDASLRRLGTDYVDIYWVHIWDTFTPIEEMMRALDDQVRAGKVLYIGISDAPAWVVARATTLAEERGWTAFSGLQSQYSLVERNAERELLPMSVNLDLSFTAWGALGTGLLSGKYNADRDTQGRLHSWGGVSEQKLEVAAAVIDVAKDIGATPSQVALSWVRQKSPTMIPIVGARKASQLQDNLGCVDVELTEEQRARLDEASAIELGFPYDFIRGGRSSFLGAVTELIDDHRGTVV